MHMRIPFVTQSMIPSPFLELGEVLTYVCGPCVGRCGSCLRVPFPIDGADVGGAGQGLPERIDAVLCDGGGVRIGRCVGGEGRKDGDVPICSMANDSSLSVRLSCR